MRAIAAGSTAPTIRLARVYPILHILVMPVTLPIGRTSREDKQRAMEALWADLSQDEAATDSPAWHRSVLSEPERLVREGKAKFSDWQSARRRIRRGKVGQD